MNKEEIINEVMGSFKMTVDAKGLKKLEKYIDNLEQENQLLKDKFAKVKNILNNQMDYREFVDIVNAIEDVVKEVD